MSTVQSYLKNSLNPADSNKAGQNLHSLGSSSKTVDSDSLSTMVQKGYEQVTGKIHKDFKNKGSASYLTALKGASKALDQFTPEKYADAVFGQIKQNRSQKGKTGPLSEAEVQLAINAVSKNVRQNFEKTMVSSMKTSLAPSLKSGGSKGSMMDFMA